MNSCPMYICEVSVIEYPIKTIARNAKFVSMTQHVVIIFVSLHRLSSNELISIQDVESLTLFFAIIKSSIPRRSLRQLPEAVY